MLQISRGHSIVVSTKLCGSLDPSSIPGAHNCFLFWHSNSRNLSLCSRIKVDEANPFLAAVPTYGQHRRGKNGEELITQLFLSFHSRKGESQEIVSCK